MKCAKCGKVLKHGELVVKVQQVLRALSGLAVFDLKDNLAHLECPTKK